MSRKKNIEIWEKLYSGGHSLDYPDSNFVSISFNLINSDIHKNILDYGFGSGNNMMPLLKRGFNVSGVEVSESALNITKQRLQKNSHKSNLQLLDNGFIPFSDNIFDVVVAWQVLYYNDWEGLNRAVSEIERVLKPGGIFLGTMASVGDSSHRNSKFIGDCLYKSDSKGQEGAFIIIVDKKDLKKCFPGKNITIGKLGLQYNDYYSSHWIISWKK